MRATHCLSPVLQCRTPNSAQSSTALCSMVHVSCTPLHVLLCRHRITAVDITSHTRTHSYSNLSTHQHAHSPTPTPSPHPQVYREPEGPNIRVDTGVTEGSEISVYYDPMVAKLITTGQTRDAALNTMGAALDRWGVLALVCRPECWKVQVCLLSSLVWRWSACRVVACVGSACAAAG
jgi:hypothetical protein